MASGKATVTVRGSNDVDTKSDILSKSLQIIDYGHHQIHDGDTFTVNNNATRGSGEQSRFLIQVPSGYYPHVLLAMRTTGEANGTLWEAASFTNAGVAMTSRNHNRAATDSSFITITHTPTISATGTLIDQAHIGSGVRAGGEGRSDGEWILDPAKGPYLVILHSEAASNDVSFHAIWYEKTVSGV